MLLERSDEPGSSGRGPSGLKISWRCDQSVRSVKRLDLHTLHGLAGIALLVREFFPYLLTGVFFPFSLSRLLDLLAATEDDSEGIEMAFRGCHGSALHRQCRSCVSKANGLKVVQQALAITGVAHVAVFNEPQAVLARPTGLLILIGERKDRLAA